MWTDDRSDQGLSGSFGPGPIAVPSRALRHNWMVQLMIEGRPVVRRPSSRCAGLIQWGNSRWTENAKRLDIPFLNLEDPFFRSVGPGKANRPSVGLIFDDLGMYYDASAASRFERLVLGPAGQDTVVRRAKSSLDFIIANDLSKYNCRFSDRPLPPGRDLILVVDQVRGDRSVPAAGASERTFERMISTALSAYPRERVVIRRHPDVEAGFARGYLEVFAAAQGIATISSRAPIGELLQLTHSVWTVSSQFGFDALLRDKPVCTFGTPFYAGWGLTTDMAAGEVFERARSRRTGRPNLLQLFSAVILYGRYFDPVTRKETSFEKSLERLIDWRNRAEQLPSGTVLVYGVSLWKRRAVKTLCVSPCAQIHFRYTSLWRLFKPRPQHAVLVWGFKDDRTIEDYCRGRGIRFFRMEDGFIRSLGLGTDLVPPMSLVLDDKGLYFDTSRPNRWEGLASSLKPSDADKRRARTLIDALCNNRLSKYNLDISSQDNEKIRSLRQYPFVSLVIGQVPSDKGFMMSAEKIKNNLSLLIKVRSVRPDAFIVFKEHPDISYKNRKSDYDYDQLTKYADLVVRSGDSVALFDAVNEVHTVSSLAGLEALLRGKPVVTWGRSFYSGWGLTEDPIGSWRKHDRKLDLETLFLITYVEYAKYCVNDVLCSLEDYLDAFLRRNVSPTLNRYAAVKLGRKLVKAFGW